MIPVFFLPSVENDYEHKGCRHTCTYERGVRLPVEKKKATGQINDLTSVAIFGVTFLFSRLFFFLHVPFCRSISFRSRNPNSRGDPVDGVTLFFFLFFFLIKRPKRFLGKASFAWSPRNCRYNKKKEKVSRKSYKHRDLRDIHHSQPEGNEERQSIDPARESSEDLLNEGRNDTIE